MRVAEESRFPPALRRGLRRDTSRREAAEKEQGTHPELVVDSWRVLLDESAIVGGDVGVVRVLLQHVNLLFDLLLFILLGGTRVSDVRWRN